MIKEHLKTNIGQYAIIIKNKKLLLLWPPNGPLWVYVGGRLDIDENDYKKALKREIKEETGLEMLDLEPFDIKMWAVNGKNHRYGVFFLSKIKNLNKEIKLSNEHIKYKWFSYEESINFEKIGKPGREIIKKLHAKKLI